MKTGTPPQLLIGGVDDYCEDSREILRLLAEGDLAAYDPDYFGGPEWAGFWLANGEKFMEHILNIIARYEELRLGVQPLAIDKKD
jgi:hypothetical protein